MTENDIVIILASASPRRAELMRQIGMEPVILPADVDENIGETDPELLVKNLAEKKCIHTEEKIMKDPRYRDRKVIIVAADTVVSVDGEILGKPADREDASQMLRRLSGREHEVLTGVCIASLNAGRQISRHSLAETTKVRVCGMSEKEIEEYIATGEPDDKAGAYGIQGRFAGFVSGIEGSYPNVVGLPVCAVYQTMKGLIHELQ